MSKPVNLNRYRKDKARAKARARADTNVVKFGRPKAETDRDRAARDLAQRRLDGHKTDE